MKLRGVWRRRELAGKERESVVTLLGLYKWHYRETKRAQRKRFLTEIERGQDCGVFVGHTKQELKLMEPQPTQTSWFKCCFDVAYNCDSFQV